MTRQRQNTSDRELTRDPRDLTGRDNLWDSSRSLDLEEQRWWVTIEGGVAPESCERVLIDHESKVDRS